MNCPTCGQVNAYVGFVKVECQNSTCEHYVSQKSSEHSGEFSSPTMNVQNETTGITLEQALDSWEFCRKSDRCFWIEQMEQNAYRPNHMFSSETLESLSLLAVQKNAAIIIEETSDHVPDLITPIQKASIFKDGRQTGKYFNVLRALNQKP